MHLRSVRSTVQAISVVTQADLIQVLNPCLKLQWIYNNWGGEESAEMVKDWIIEQVSKPASLQCR